MSKIGSFLIDLGSITTLFGIYPRYIEPRLLSTTYLSLHIPPPRGLKPALRGLKIVHFTDLHFHKGSSKSFLKRVQRQILKHKADLIVFTGDFLCYSQLEQATELENFLKPLKAPLGSYCVFGNHDYGNYVSRDQEGNYSIRKPINPLKGLWTGLKTIFTKENKRIGVVTESAKKTPLHTQLVALLEKTPFQILENTTKILDKVGLNIVGLGEYGLGRCLPEKAFQNYDSRYPGIVLVHNPDGFSSLKSFPGDLILAGHTHGEQIHLPFYRKLSQKLTRLENPHLSRGLYTFPSKTLYVNRGIAGHKPFRFCSRPEILVVEIT